MSNAFDGSRIIAQSGAVMAQIRDLGGVTKLTGAEQAKANAILEAGLEKYRTLGREAPPGMQKLADETKQVDTTTSGLTATVKQLALGFVGMFTARAAFNFLKSTLDEASALSDLSSQVRIGVEELQVMRAAVAEFGVDTAELGNGLFQLSRRIAKGDDSVSDALKQMGMELSDVKGMQGEELFLTILRGLSGLQGGLRDTTASELFGSKLGAAMAGASEGIDGAMARARELNTVMSEESVQALDQYGEAIERATTSLGNMAANMIGPVAQGFNVLIDAAGRGASKWDIAVAMARDLGDSWDKGAESTTHLTALLDELNQKTDGTATSTKKATAATLEFAPALESTAGATKKARDEADALEKANTKLEASYAKLMSEIKNANQLALMEDEAAAMKQNAEQAAMFAEQDMQARIRRGQAATDQAAAEATAETARIAANQAEIDGILAAGAAHVDAGAMAKTGTDQTVAGYAAVAQQVTLAAGVITEWNNLMVYTAKAQAILSSGSSLFTSQSQRDRLANLPARARGGPVSGGSPYMVGERGPEMFVPERSGTIVPNGGGSNITIAPVLHFHGPVLGSSLEFDAAVSGALLNVLKSGAVSIPAGVG